MAAQDQLEIINSQGEIRFHGLDGGGITNIGRHPDNDIIIDSPVVAPFHAILDHQQKPYRLVALNAEGQIKVSGQVLQANVPRELRNWDTIELDGHSLILLESGAASGAPAPFIAPTPLPTPIPASPPPMGEPTSGAPGGGDLPSDIPDLDELDRLLSMLPEDRSDDLIIVEPVAQNGAIDPNHTSALDFRVDVEQPATMQVTVTNGGSLVGEFVCEVRGLDPTWVAVTPPSINLNDGERGNFSIAISAPRLASSRAKAYYFSVVVTSPDYPGRMNSIGGLLVLNPFYAYAVGDINPKKQNISYSKRVGKAVIPITNLGNGPASFQAMGEDERHAATIEFDSPEEGLKLVGQVQFKVEPEETLSLPIFVTPRKRRFVGFGAEDIQYTVTVTPVGGDQPTPRSVLAQSRSTPFIGPIPIILLAILALLLVGWMFTPSIADLTADKTEITSGDEVILSWRAGLFSGLKLEPAIGKVDGPQGSQTVAPLEDTTYTLSAETFLTWIMPQWFTATKEVKVLVNPLLPEIRLFEASATTINTGDEVIINWDVIRAETLILSIDGADETIAADQLIGSRTFKLERDTIFTLRAVNRYVPDGVQQSVTVRAVVPSPTPLPEPIIQQFDVLPLAITAGEAITITWDVKNVSKVTIDGVDGELPPSGTVTVRPQTNTAYVLKATNGQVEKTSIIQQVIVSPAPSATPEPGAPKIDFFLANPAEVAFGSPEASNVQLSWQVTGDTTSVEITGPNNSKFSGLTKSGSLTVAIDKATLYVLTAFNGSSLRTSATAQIKVKNPVPKITSLVPSSSSNVGGSGFVLTVNGSGFTKDSKVQWGGSNHSTVYVKESQLTASILAEDLVKAGTFEVKVFNPSPGGGTSGGVTFTLNNPIPSLVSLSPGSVTKGSTSITMTVNGTNFVSGSLVRFGGADAPTTFVSSTELTAQITAGQLASAGTPLVTVFNPGPGGGTSGSIQFTINPSNPAPTLNLLSAPVNPGLVPSSVSAGGGDLPITVNGSNFIQGSLVRLQGLVLPTIYVSDTRLTATVPQSKLATAGTAKVSVVNPTPGGGVSNLLDFTITGVTVTVDPETPPSIVPKDGVKQMVVSLSSLQAGTTTVQLSTNSALLVVLHPFAGSCDTGTVLTSVDIVPPATSADFCVEGLSEGNAIVTASLPAALGGGIDNQTITVFGDAPIIQSLSVSPSIQGNPLPGIGVGSSSFQLTITGLNFSPSSSPSLRSQVQFGAFGPIAANSVGSTTIVVTINNAYVAALPGSIDSGVDVVIINPGSIMSVPDPASRFFINMPVLSSVSPNTKIAGDGNFVLTVNGQNFASLSTVQFNGATLAQKPGGTSTQFTVDVPSTSIQNVGILPVTVTNPGGFVSGSQNLTVNAPTISMLPASLTTTVGAAGTVFTVSISPVQSVARTIDLSGAAALTLKDSSCVSNLSSAQISIPAGSASAQFCAVANAVTSGSQTLTATLTGFTSTDTSTITVNAASATLSLITSDAIVVSGEPVTLTATVTSGGGTPTGSVTFSDSVNGTLCLNVPLSGDQAACTTGITYGGVASHTVTATFTSTDPNIASGANDTVVETLSRASTQIALNQSTTTSVYGQPITFTANLDVTAPGSGSPTGNLELRNGVTTLDTTALSGSFDGVDITPSSFLGATTYSLTAAYVGDTNFNSSTSSPAQSHIVSPANTTTTVVKTSPASPVTGETVRLTTTVTANSPSTATPIGNVTFKDSGVDITGCVGVALSAGSAICDTSFTAASSPTSITVDYAGNSNFNVSSTAAPLVFTISPASVTVAIISSANPSVYGQAVTFTVNVTTNTPGSGTPTGEITLRFNGTAVTGCNPATLISGSTTCSMPALQNASASAYPVVVDYNNLDGSWNDLNNTAMSPGQTVNAVTTSTSVTSSDGDNATIFGQSFTLTAVVTNTNGTSQTPPGTVTFTSTVVGNITGCVGVSASSTTANTATFTCAVRDQLPGSTGGTAYDLTAAYTSSSTNFTSSADASPITHTVTNPTISFTAGPTPAIIDLSMGQTSSLTITITAQQSTTTVINLTHTTAFISTPLTVTIPANTSTVIVTVSPVAAGIGATVTGAIDGAEGIGTDSTGPSSTITVTP